MASSGTLTELIREKPTQGPERADLNYVEKEVTAIPDFYRNIQLQMKGLEDVQKRLRRRVATKTNRLLGFTHSFSESVKANTLVDYKKTTVDDLILEEVEIMRTLNEDVTGAMVHSRDEARHLQRYGNKVMSEFEQGKTAMQRKNRQYNDAGNRLRDLENVLGNMSIAHTNFTPVKTKYDRVKRFRHAVWNKREVYSARVKFRLAERKDLLMKENTVSTTLYELEKMQDYLTMFLDNVQETFGSTTLIQVAYQTAEALQNSYVVLSEIAHSRSLITQGSVSRLADAVQGTTYEFRTFLPSFFPLLMFFRHCS